MTFKKGDKPPQRGQGEGIKFLREHVTYAGDDCLIWPLNKGDGYGSLGYNGKIYRVHRFMCELAHGPAPTPAHQAAHSCGNGHKACVNPKHLSWKTNGENQLDRCSHGTKNMISFSWRGKLTSEQHNEIRNLSESMTQMQLAERFGVSRSTIQYSLYGGSYQPRREGTVRKAKGYSRSGNKWKARIKVNNRVVYLGSFDTERDARLAYESAIHRMQSS